ncbi:MULTISPECIES: PP2C family protein-serine/threonine phosphatase [unclassified Streptomyces]|uniref:PP2C family protein-serine/threonine phosphatase n=1 Tax=unclassified Streptomyces TaxID=2593676 RepID=UPI00365F93E7
MTTQFGYGNVRVATATRTGTATPSGDAVAVHVQTDGTTAAAVVDGIGHSHRVASVAELLATVMARVAARRGSLAGLLTGTELVADKGAGDEQEPDAVAVVATVTASATASWSTSGSTSASEEERIRVAWVGDCRAYALEGGRLRPLTADHNLAEHLALCGYTGEIPRQAAKWVRTTVRSAAVATVSEAWTRSPLVVLMSDGVHDQVPHGAMEALALRYEDDPQALSEALVAAATGADGVRDDATALVIRRG